MKKYLFLIIVCLILKCTTLFGQQEPMNTMFAYNKLQTNPAYTGGKDLLSMRAVYRTQWVKLPGAPRTINFNIHSPVKKERIAVGLSVLNDIAGSVNQTNLTPSFAYRIPFKNDTKLSFGISAGIKFYKINVTTLTATDVNDPLLGTNYSGVAPTMGFGLYYYGRKFYVGLSSPNILPMDLIRKNKELAQMTTDRFQQVGHMYLSGGYTFEIGKKKNFWIQPQLLFKYLMTSKYKIPFEIDANLTFTLYKIANIGLTYRTGFANIYDNRESIDIMTMFNLPKGFSVAYSYDITLANSKTFHNNSHEILLGYDVDIRKKGVRTPRYF